MPIYLKALGMHVYLVTTKKAYLDNDKYIEANAQSLEALRHILNKYYLSIIFHCDFAFTVWNTLTSLSYRRQTMWRRNPWWMSPMKLAI